MHQTILFLGKGPFSAYEFFIFLGYLIGIGIILVLAKKQRFPMAETSAYVLFAVTASLIGAKIFLWVWDLAQNPDFYIRNPHRLWHMPQGGGASFGAIGGAVLFSLWYLRRFKLPLWQMGDTVAPGLAVAQAIMKLGCYTAGCCYGTPSRLPWAVKLPGEAVLRHPVQIYESILYFLNFVFLLMLFKRKRFPGRLIAVYIINFSLFRFMAEYFRGDPYRHYVLRGISPWSSLSYPQFICLIGLLFGIGLYLKRRKDNRSRSKVGNTQRIMG